LAFVIFEKPTSALVFAPYPHETIFVSFRIILEALAFYAFLLCFVNVGWLHAAAHSTVFTGETSRDGEDDGFWLQGVGGLRGIAYLDYGLSRRKLRVLYGTLFRHNDVLWGRENMSSDNSIAQRKKRTIGIIAIILLIVFTVLALTGYISIMVWVIADLVVAGVANLLFRRIGRRPLWFPPEKDKKAEFSFP
jgi:hypothetical protein